MQSIALASIAYEVGYKVGDTSSIFLSRVKAYLNDRYDDCLMRTQATMWSISSTASLADAAIPQLGLGRVIADGATADAYDAKRQFQKAAKYEQKYQWELANFVISQPWTQINASFSRYDFHEE
jgi:hypothetical protein